MHCISLAGNSNTSIFRYLLVRITPKPPLTWLRRSDHRVMDFVVMRCHMLMRGVVTTKCYTAGLTRAEMYPLRVQPDTFLTDLCLGGLDVGNSGQVFAKCCHGRKD